MTFLAGLLAIVGTTAASAALLETKPGEKTIEGVRLAKEAVFKGESGPVKLDLYVSGLRKKKVALFWAKVYVGQILAAPGLKPPTTLAEARATLSKQPVVGISMTFLRDVGASRVKDGFEDSLEANGYDPKSEELKPLFAIVEKGGDAKDTLPITLVFERRKDGTEWLHYENANGEIQSMGFQPGILAKLLAIWDGKPADSGMERLQNQFIGKSDDLKAIKSSTGSRSVLCIRAGNRNFPEPSARRKPWSSVKIKNFFFESEKVLRGNLCQFLDCSFHSKAELVERCFG